MKLWVYLNDDICDTINVEYTPVEALIINQAMQRYADDEEIKEEDRNIMKQMLDVRPIFIDIAEK